MRPPIVFARGGFRVAAGRRPLQFIFPAPFSTQPPSPSKFADVVRKRSEQPREAPLGTPAVSGPIDESRDQTPPDAPPRGLLQRVKVMVKEFGAYAIGLYASLWLGPLVGVYELCVVNENFGYTSPAPLLTSLGVKDWVYGLLHLPPDARPEPWQVSAAFAYIAAEVAEPIRFPLTLFLAPRLKRWVAARRGGVATPSADKSGHSTGESTPTK